MDHQSEKKILKTSAEAALPQPTESSTESLSLLPAFGTSDENTISTIDFSLLLWKTKPAEFPSECLNDALQRLTKPLNSLDEAMAFLVELWLQLKTSTGFGATVLMWNKAFTEAFAQLRATQTPLNSPLKKDLHNATPWSWDKFFSRNLSPYQSIDLAAVRQSLFSAAEWVANTPSAHSGICSLVQSSGWGKSRAIKELSKEIPLLYLCVAPANASCYPKRSALWALHFDVENADHRENFLGRWLEASVLSLETWSRNERLPMTREQWWAFQAEQPTLHTWTKPTGRENPVSLIEKYRSYWNISDETPILFVVDEARALIDNSRMISFFRYFRRSVQSLRDMRVLGLCLDTSARVSNFSPALSIDPSLRLQASLGRYDLYPPFFALTGIPNGVLYGVSFEKTMTLQHFIAIGRPLWRVLGDTTLSMDEIHAYAECKLNAGQQISANCLTETTSVAIVAFCAGINFQPAASIAQTLVASHMAVLLHVGQDRDFVSIGWPIEPMLAFAAAGVLARMPAKILDQLHSLAIKLIPNLGGMGELCARIVLMMARRPYAKPLSVKAFLQNILPDSGRLQAILEKIDLELIDGYVNFLQFTQINTAVAQSDLAHALRVLCGFSARPNQPAYDIVIPVFRGRMNDEITTNNASGIWIQVKNRYWQKSRNFCDETSRALVRHLESEGKRHRKIVIVLHLGMDGGDTIIQDDKHLVIATNPLYARAIHEEVRPRLAALARARYTPEFNTIKEHYGFSSVVGDSIENHFTTYAYPYDGIKAATKRNRKRTRKDFQDS